MGSRHRIRDAVSPEWVPGGLSDRLCAESLHREALSAVRLIEADLSLILDHYFLILQILAQYYLAALQLLQHLCCLLVGQVQACAALASE